MKTLSLILTIAIIVGCLYVIVPALGKAFTFLNASKPAPQPSIDLWHELIDAGFEEHDIEQRLVAGISLEEQHQEAVSDGFIIIEDLPSPQEQAIINRRFSPAE